MPASQQETERKPEVPRKVLHLVVAIFPLIALELGRPTTLAIVLPLTAFAVAADGLRARSAGFERFIQKVFGFMMRASEAAQSGRINVNGATWVLISFSILILAFPFSIALSALFVFMLGDAFAALVGQRLGRHRWPGNERTVEGTTAFIVVGVVASAVFGYPGIVASLPAVVAGAATEAFRLPLNDNLRVPIVIAATLMLTVWAANLT